MSEHRILVTGANGFIGSRLVSWLVHQGRTISAAVRTPNDGDELTDMGCDIVAVGEIGRTTDWSRALDGVDVVVHLAGRAHVLGENSTNPIDGFRAVNRDGTTRLAEQAAGRVRRLVFVSSIGVNGIRTVGVPFSASSPPAPVEDYAISKYEAEQALRAVSEKTGLEVVVVRPPLVYGPRCPGNFLRLLRLLDSGIPLPFASIRNVRSFIYVDNLASALLACAEHPLAAGRTYLVDDGETISTPDLVRTLRSLMGRKPFLVPCPVPLLRWIARVAGRSETVAKLTDSLVIDGSAIRGETGWQPPRSMAQGLANTVRWYGRHDSDTCSGRTAR